MKTALVIHPRFTVYGGGELLSIYVCKTLQEAGYHVKLVSDNYDPEQAEKIYGLGKVLAECEHVPIPPFKPFFRKGLAFQRLLYARQFANHISQINADISFSTQSSLFRHEGLMYHFLYDIVDLFRYPENITYLDSTMRQWYKRPYYSLLRRFRSKAKVSHFFALSNNVLNELNRLGYHNSSLIYPPCRMTFNPKMKKNRVVQVTRIVPQKRLEWFLEIARQVPEYQFLIVGRDDSGLQKLNPGYTSRLFKNNPQNFTYVEAPISQCPELLEESKVYLYTGLEPGIGIALVEAIHAGCYPITPTEGGGAEVVDACQVGTKFETVEQAVSAVRLAMKSFNNRDWISQQALAFSPEHFQKEIASLL